LSYLKQLDISESYDKTKINISGVLAGVQKTIVFIVSKQYKNGGFLIVSVGTEYILELQSKVAFGERGHAVIVDQFGKVIAHPVKKWHETRKDISFLPPVQKMMPGLTDVTQFYTPAMGADMIAGHTVVELGAWSLELGVWWCLCHF